MKLHTVYKQHGAVLIVSLIMLAVMTLFVISMLKTSILELKIGGASQAAALNAANAELAINNFIALNNGKFAPGFLALGTADFTKPSFFDGDVNLTATQVSCLGDSSVNSGYGVNSIDIVRFDIRAVANDRFGGETTVVQGVSSFAPQDGCGA